jgi:hypothetical protein
MILADMNAMTERYMALMSFAFPQLANAAIKNKGNTDPSRSQSFRLLWGYNDKTDDMKRKKENRNIQPVTLSLNTSLSLTDFSATIKNIAIENIIEGETVNIPMGRSEYRVPRN